MPLIAPGLAGTVVLISTALVTVTNPQSLEAVSFTSPAVAPAFTVIVVVPCPETIVQPVGTAQVYFETFVPAGTVKVEFPVAQTAAVPVMPVMPVTAPEIDETANVDAAPVPQPLLADTLIFPADAPVFTTMVLLFCDTIVQPVGTVQV